ncbi:MAG: hypothetical protein OXE40_01960, partial [Gammaproteobacteria bacterium]|nr:hypothetical protein [Gammaproteobacteria bacterium]
AWGQGQGVSAAAGPDRPRGKGSGVVAERAQPPGGAPDENLLGFWPGAVVLAGSGACGRAAQEERGAAGGERNGKGPKQPNDARYSSSAMVASRSQTRFE